MLGEGGKIGAFVEAKNAEIEALRQSEFVEYERVAALKLRFLKLLFLQFLREWRSDAPRVVEFREYLAREGDLVGLSVDAGKLHLFDAQTEARLS